MTEITDDLPARLLHEEHSGWRALLDGRGGEHWTRAMTRDGVVIVGSAVFGRDDMMRAFAGASPWTSYEIHEPAVVRLGDRAGVLVYRAVARRGDDEAPTELRISTTYVYDDGGWRIAAHQHTALG